MTTARHVPVLLGEVLTALAPIAGQDFIDGTFGAGGYTAALLEGGARRVIAIDRDPSAICGGFNLLAANPGRLTLRHGRIRDIERIADEVGLAAVDGVVLDVGVSSMQLDDPERGFSFMSDGPLDMRMSETGLSAADVVNTASEQELADILFHLGEERRARAIARAIAADRTTRPFTRTAELAGLVERVIGRAREPGRHPATRTFQALRIYVNDELGELALALAGAEARLRPGGRLAVVTFHSLEDRIVKTFLRERTGREAAPSRHAAPSSQPQKPPSFHFVNQRALSPSDEEIARNPRARSARLRWAVRTEAAAWGGTVTPPGPHMNRA
ncbi:MAG: 16S rRNA (cytosine(1402)-N(4))-methyltransferase RsmH [Hyphomicrobiaceae bacterium]